MSEILNLEIHFVSLVVVVNFTLDHDNNFLVHLEVVAVDSRQQLDLIVKMVAYWAFVLLVAWSAEYIDLNLHTNYFVQLVAVVDASPKWLAFDYRVLAFDYDIVAVVHTMLYMTMHMSNAHFHLLLSVVELVGYPMN